MNHDLEDLKRLVRLQLGITEVNDHDRLVEDLDAESIDIVNLIVDIEAVFDVSIDDADLDGVATVGELWEVVERAAITS